MGCDHGLCAQFLGWLSAYTYPIVFAGTLIDASGIPFPGRLLLIAAGALAGGGDRHVAVVIAAGAVAAMAMDHVWYLAGARGSTRVLDLYRRLSGSSGDRDDPTIDYFARYGAFTIVLGRFFTLIRVLAWPAAAAQGVGYLKFALFDLAGATVWTSLWVLLGWMVGWRWQSAAETTGIWLAAAGVVIGAIALAPLAMRIFKRWRRRRARHARSTAPAR